MDPRRSNFSLAVGSWLELSRDEGDQLRGANQINCAHTQYERRKLGRNNAARLIPEDYRSVIAMHWDAPRVTFDR